MILGAGVKAYVCAVPVDMRRSIDGLAQLVAPVFGGDPFGGAVYVFLGKRRNRVKLLWWDRHGFFLLYKRLERGRFPSAQALAQRGLSPAELMAFLDGIDLSHARSLAPVQASRVA